MTFYRLDMFIVTDTLNFPGLFPITT